MSYIPDCRTKFIKDIEFPFKRHTDEPIDEHEINGYWYGLLEGNDKEFIRGFDCNTTYAVNKFFDNIHIYAAEFERIGLDVENIDAEIVNGLDPYNDDGSTDERPYKNFDDFSMEELEQLSRETQIALLLKHILNDYIEMVRGELVTSMIDSMDDDTHTKNLEKAYNENKKEV